MKNVNHHYYRTQAVIFLLVILAYALPLFVIGLLESMLDMTLVVFGVITMIFAGPTIYLCLQWRHYATVKLTEIQTVFLSDISAGWFHVVGFKVKATVDGTEQTFITKEVFGTRPFQRLNLETYLNQKARVGYDKTRDELVIIDLESNR